MVAIDRHFFQSVGGYDPGMLLWGEEQIELSIRVTFFIFIIIIKLIHLLSAVVSHLKRFSRRLSGPQECCSGT